MTRVVKDQLKLAWHTAFLSLERLGVHMTPVHFYSGVPNVSRLAASRDTWSPRSDLPGLNVDVDAQVANLRLICLPFQKEYQRLGIYQEAVRCNGGEGFGPIESEALHGFMRSFQPRRVIQIGCGLATYCVLRAAEQNDRSCDLVCVEPFPNDFVRTNRQIQLIAQPVQQVPLTVFDQLGPGDILFIDSTHVVQVGSDVNFLVLEVLPRLRPGVLVHFHDIYLPYDYPRDFLQTIVFPLETSLVRAFLIQNRSIEIVACLSQLHYDRPTELQEIFPDYVAEPNDAGLRSGPHTHGHFPSSLWLRTC
jgi:hypothetical protein